MRSGLCTLCIVTVPAVPGIIDALNKRGYVFVTVPQLLAPGMAEPGKVYR